MKNHFTRICLVVTVLGFQGCSDKPLRSGDSVPPSAITDLVVGHPVGNSLTVAFRATGDDSTEGRATAYDLRYSKAPITQETWSQSTRYMDTGRPLRAGVFEGCRVYGLDPTTLYYFGLKVADESYNWSSLSNVVSGFTTDYADSIPPATITDLAVDSSTPFSITLSWTAPGDDSMTNHASEYDVRFSVVPILSEIDWGFSARLVGEPIPGAPGTRESMTVTGLKPNQLFYFAIRAGDEIVNWSPLPLHLPASTLRAETIPPAAITDLAMGWSTFNSIQIFWTAPGDDGHVGLASTYDIRLHGYPITESNWDDCVQISQEPTPAPPGTQQFMVVTGLQPFRYYHIAMRTADEIPNWSPLSNVITFLTNAEAGLEDTIPPGRVSDLSVIAASQTAITLRWRAAGDDFFAGNAIQHDLRYATDSISVANWDSAIVVDYVLPPRAGGTVMSMDVKFLEPGTTYFFGIRTKDESDNWSLVSNIPRGTTRP